MRGGFTEVRSTRRLRYVLVLFVVAPVLLVVASGWLLMLDRVESLAEQRMQEEIELVARTLSIPLAEALRQRSIDRVYESLRAADELNRVYGAFVYQPDGVVIAAMGTPPSVRTNEISQIAADGSNTGAYGERGGRRVFSYFVPLAGLGGQVAGVLEVTRRQSDIEAYVANTRTQTTLVLMGFAALAVGLVMWGHHRALGRHVERLADDMGLVMRGDRMHRASAAGFHEVNVLASSLNGMLDAIAASQRELDDRREAQLGLTLRLHHSEKVAAAGALAAGVAHELGTPLSVVRGRTQRLLRDTTLHRAIAHGVREIQDQVARMEATVRHLLEADGRRHRSSREAVDVVGLIRHLVEADRAVADPAAVSVEIDAGDDAPATRLDVTAFEIALNNLVRNAVQAASHAVVVRVAFASHELRICVDDDGPGVPEPLRARIWDPFFTTKSPAEGTGLGLALTHRAVSDMGGHLRVSTSPEGGARFEMLLPREAPE